MKKIILSAIILLIISCNKEEPVSNNHQNIQNTNGNIVGTWNLSFTQYCSGGVNTNVQTEQIQFTPTQLLQNGYAYDYEVLNDSIMVLDGTTMEYYLSNDTLYYRVENYCNFQFNYPYNVYIKS